MKQLLRVFCLFYLACGFAQVPKSLDSLNVFLKTKPQDTTYVKALNEYVFLFIQQGKIDQAKEKIALMERLSNRFNFGLGFYQTSNMKGFIEYSQQNSEKALEYFLRCQEFVTKYKLPKSTKQNILNNIGIVYSQMGDRDNATAYAMKLVDFQEKNNLHPFKSFPYAQIGDNLKFYKKYDEALVYFKKMLNVETRKKNISGMAIAENNVGNIFDDVERYELAAKHYEMGLRYAVKAEYPLLQTDLLINLGRIHKKMGNYAKAESNYRKSEAICKDLDVKDPLKTIYQNLGELYLAQKKYALAESHYLKSLAIAKDIKNPELLQSINTALAEFNYETGNYKLAYEYMEAAEVYKDSTFKIENAKNTENLLRKYEAKKKEQEIAVLSAQNTIKNLQINDASRQRWYFILGILALGIIGTLLFYQSQNRKKTNQKLQVLNAELDNANKIKARFFSILNHDLRSPVSTLIHFLHLQKHSPELLDEASKLRMENRTIASAENLLDSMEDILLWSKGQMENFRPHLQNISVNSLFFDLEKHFSSVENIEIIFENDENLNLFSDENYLKTILRNLTGNAIKALEKTENARIVLKASKENNRVFISVSDNGPGGTMEKFRALYDEKEVVGIKSGLGLHLIRDLAKAIDCKVAVDTSIGSGTMFTLSF